MSRSQGGAVLDGPHGTAPARAHAGPTSSGTCAPARDDGACIAAATAWIVQARREIGLLGGSAAEGDRAERLARAELDLQRAIDLLASVSKRAVEPPQVLAAGPVTIDLAQRRTAVGSRRLALTALEFKLLCFFVRHPQVPLDRTLLLAEVWGYSVGGTSTVTVHVRRLRAKLESDPLHPTLIRTVWGIGYRFCPEDEDAVPTAGDHVVAASGCSTRAAEFRQ